MLGTKLGPFTDGQPFHVGNASFNTVATSYAQATLPSIPIGQHTFSVVADATNLVSETNEGNNQSTKIFTAVDCSLFSISGQVKDSNNNLISNVIISDGAGHTATTDANGNYTLSSLATGTYTLTPTKNGYTFSPTSRTITVPPNATAMNFMGATPTGTIITVPIIQGSDDAGTHYLCSSSAAENEIYFGQCNTGNPMTSGFRFQNVQIPAGATINEAHLEFTVDGSGNNQVAIKFFGERSANAATFTNADGPANRSLSTAFVPWPITDPWNLQGARSSPNLASIIQEIVNLPAWASGNSLAIISQTDSAVPNNTYRRVFAWEREKNSNHTARLVVNYTPRQTSFVSSKITDANNNTHVYSRRQ